MVFNREHCVRNGGLARACFFIRESLANLHAPPTLLVITVSGNTIPAYHVVKNGDASRTAFWRSHDGPELVSCIRENGNAAAYPE